MEGCVGGMYQIAFPVISVAGFADIVTMGSTCTRKHLHTKNVIPACEGFVWVLCHRVVGHSQTRTPTQS